MNEECSIYREIFHWFWAKIMGFPRATDDKSSYVILSMFFSLFLYEITTKRRNIRTIAYDFGTFVMFSIFESVIFSLLET